MANRWSLCSLSALLVSSLSTPVLASGAGARPGDARRALLFVDAELGPAYVDMLALKDAELLDETRVKSSGFGFAYGTALGVWLQDFTLAARYRRADFADWQVWTLGGEAGMRFTLGRLEPHWSLGAAYAALTGTRGDFVTLLYTYRGPDIDIHGLDLRASVGVDYYVAQWLSVGSKLTGDAFFLRRKGDHIVRTSSSDPNSPPPFLYGIDGSGSGLGATLGLVLALRY